MSYYKKMDVVVIGGGPAGMISTGRAGQLSHSVLILEKNFITSLNTVKYYCVEEDY